MTNDKLREAVESVQQDMDEQPIYKTVVASKSDVALLLEAARAALAAPVEAQPVARVLAGSTRNQCDACVNGFPRDADGMHRDGQGRPIMTCQASRYAHPAEQGKDAEDAIPREPTDAMIEVGGWTLERVSQLDATHEEEVADVWRAMWDAARNATKGK
jgi:hypothetical protein